MQVTWVQENGDTTPEDMPCFGNTGRVDWKGCNRKLRSDIYERSEELDISVPAKQDSVQEMWTEKSPVTHIRLKQDDYFRHLFHVSFFPLLEYIVHRSIWAPLFDQSAEEIQKQNYINFRVDVLPSEIQTTLHIWCRDVFGRSGITDTFVSLREGLGNEHLAFILAVYFPQLGIGSTSSTMGNEGLSSHGKLDFWINPDISKLKVIPYTMREVHGYVMNVTKVWKTHGKINAGAFSDYIRRYDKPYVVKGLFGNVTMTGVQNPVQLIKEFFQSKGIEL